MKNSRKINMFFNKFRGAGRKAFKNDRSLSVGSVESFSRGVLTTEFVKEPINIILLLFGCFFYCTSSAQSVLVDGTEWHYNMPLFVEPEVKSNKFTISGDTIIQNIACKVLVREYESCDLRPWEEFLYEENNKVYFYDSENGQFKMLYDYDMELGEVKEFPFWPNTGYDSYFVRVDGLDTLEINGIALKRFTVAYGVKPYEEIEYFITDSEIIEQIGSKKNYFHFPDLGLCDWQYNTSLRCFNSMETGEINYDSIDCDLDYFIISNSNIDISQTQRVAVYPNPTNGIITIEFQQALKEAQVLHVLDIRGSHVTSYKIPSGKAELDLNVSNLDSGLFFYTIEINGKVNLGKIVLTKH